MPDGFAIIVGGLTQNKVRSTRNAIPYLEGVPILRELVTLTANQSRDSSRFVFLRPVILEEDKLRGLKQLFKRSF